MSGLLGNDGPGLMGKLLARNEKKYGNVEKPGFSDTMKQNKRGEWYSVQERADRKRRRNRGRIIGGATSAAMGAPPGVAVRSAYTLGKLGG